MAVRAFKRLRLAATVGLCGLAVGCWQGCDAQQRYRILSFFFDGVPDPNAPRGVTMAPGAGRPDGRAGVTYYAHKPYDEQKCADCHSEVDIYALSTDTQMCLKCHAAVRGGRPFMHGPVQAMACQWCHVAHESPYPALLRGAPVSVCTQCHRGEFLGLTVQAHRPPQQDCLDCHFGHGGPRPFLLRDQPTTVPASAAAPEGPP